jgi:NADP-reducing hydrogenase subunit HndD
MAKITITLNGEQVQVESGSTVLEAAKEAGVAIPTLCHHPALSGFGACRMCVVKIEGMRNLPASCVTKVTPGMVIETHAPEVVEARRTILELLLANHPLDCLTCDKGGDCRLQDYAYEYEVAESSFVGERHQYEIDDSSPYIIRDNNKCILCGQCIRACSEIKGMNILGFANRGFDTKVTPAFDVNFADSDCVDCHNCVAVCPVGALMPKELAGKARQWEVTKHELTCTFCEFGCKFNLVKKGNEIVGVEAKSGGPGRPLCLKGRLGLDLIYNPNPTAKPLIKKNGKYVPVDWEEALRIRAIINKLNQMQVTE